MNMHLYDFRWINENETEFQAVYQNRFGRKRVKRGDSLSLKITGGIHCAGSYRHGEWRACPETSRGKRKCEICRNREGNFIFTTFDGFNTDIFGAEDLAQIQGEHWVYLALFEKNLVKIGVSKADRKILRQLEQGSHFTLFIAKTPDGVSARQIETLFRQSGMSDKIPSQSKKDFLCPDILEKTGENILMDLVKNPQEILKNAPHLVEYFLETPEFFSWQSFYGLSEIQESSKTFNYVKLGVSESVSGKILAIKGPFVVLETNEELVSVCTKDLLGYEIDFTPTPFGLKLAGALQHSLF